VARGFVVLGLLWAAAPALAWAFQDDAPVSVIRSVGAIAASRILQLALAIRRLDFQRLPLLAAWGGIDGIAQAVLLANAVAAVLALRLSARVLSG
jgi:hypothetical protein